MIKKIAQISLQTVFPAICFGCEAWGEYLCNKCAKKLVMLDHQECPSCRRKTSNGQYCSPICKESFYFDQLVVAMRYDQNPLLRRLIKALKYRFYQDIADKLAYFLESKISLVSDFDFVTFVPLHTKRLKYRGFNQAKKIAESAFPVVKLLRRNSYEVNQARLNRNQRWENMEKTIKINLDWRKHVNQKKILVIDDVATTGSTLNACAKTLKLNGAREVSCMVLARSNIM